MKKVAVIYVATPNDSNIRKKEHKKLEKYQELRGGRVDVEGEGVSRSTQGNDEKRVLQCNIATQICVFNSFYMRIKFS